VKTLVVLLAMVLSSQRLETQINPGALQPELDLSFTLDLLWSVDGLDLPLVIENVSWERPHIRRTKIARIQCTEV
jgi:hypothetical protein